MFFYFFPLPRPKKKIKEFTISNKKDEKRKGEKVLCKGKCVYYDSSFPVLFFISTTLTNLQAIYHYCIISSLKTRNSQFLCFTTYLTAWHVESSDNVYQMNTENQKKKKKKPRYLQLPTGKRGSCLQRDVQILKTKNDSEFGNIFYTGGKANTSDVSPCSRSFHFRPCDLCVHPKAITLASPRTVKHPKRSEASCSRCHRPPPVLLFLTALHITSCPKPSRWRK